MKRLFVLLATLGLMVSSAQAEALRAGTFRGSLNQVGSVEVQDGQPSKIAWAAKVTADGGEFMVRNLRGFTYRVVKNPLRANEYLGTTLSEIQTGLCTGTPSIRIRTNKGANKIVLFQTIDFDCINSQGSSYAYTRTYAGTLNKQ